MGQKSKISTQPPQINTVLAIETSCDDTSVAILNESGFVEALLSENQDSIHGPYGGVIPEMACRNHTTRLMPLVLKAMEKSGKTWNEIDGIAVTNRPGLLGSLLVGVTVAKTLSLIFEKPLIGVNHIEGHLYAPFLKDENFDLKKDINTPFLGLCVSGGHTSLIWVQKFGKYKVLGRTQDDAAGEAFDKFGKLIGMGYPAGREVDMLARKGDPKAFEFPRPLLKSKDLNFSFSGLKTAGKFTIEKTKNSNMEISEKLRADLCASYQEAICDVLIEKLSRGIKITKIQTVSITGGVSCNSKLRERATLMGKQMGVEVLMSPPSYCTDNAAMIGYVGLEKLRRGERDNLKLSPLASGKFQELI